MKHLLHLSLCTVLMLISNSVNAQALSKIDSLTNLLSEYTEPDTSRVRVLNLLADQLLQNDQDEAEKHANEASELARKLNDKAGEAESLFLLTYMSIYKGDTDEAIIKANELVGLYQQLDDKGQEAQTNYLLGYLTNQKGDNDRAKVYYLRCIELAKLIKYNDALSKGFSGLAYLLENDGELDEALKYYKSGLDMSISEKSIGGQASGYNNMGRIYERIGDTEKALESYMQSMRLAEEMESPRLIAQAAGNVGLLYSDQKNYELATKYIDKGLDVNRKSKNKKGIAQSLQSKANLLRRQEKYKEALELYAEVMEIRKSIDDQRGISYTNHQLAGTYFRMDRLDLSEGYRLKSLNGFRKIGHKRGEAMTLLHLGQLHIKKKQYNKALNYLNDGLPLAEELNSPDELERAYNFLQQAYAGLGKYGKAYAFQKEYQAVKDSMFTLDQNKQLANMQIRYDTEKKEKQIALQNNEIMELETNNAKVARQRNYTFGGASLLGLLAFLGYRVNKIRKDRNDKIEFAEALLFTQEEERKRIARDLHDSIGQSLLLVKKELMGNNAVTHQNQALISNTLEEVRSISRDLHPFQLEKFGLTSTIKDVLEKVQKSSGLFITHDIDEIDENLSDKTQIHLYRVIQESFNNIIKHAKATAANLVIKNKDGNLEIAIKDNGIGYDHEYALVKSKSLGLRTMHERISAIGGKLKVRGGDPQGTIIEINIPVD